ncbi:MAG: DUF4238 domain-containing protein [Oliverpabstia sp.]|nr:DUF4238 domain-containing protein [Oliverpabstia sp.]
MKNEHYVPRRYLRHFANNKKFFVYDKEQRKNRPGSIEDYASERYFYDVDFEALKQEKLEQDPDFQFDPEIEKFMKEVDEQYIEKWFAENVETWLFDPIDKIITKFVMSNPSTLTVQEVLDDLELNSLALYMAIQIVRSKEFRNYIVEMNERFPLLMAKKIAQQNQDKELLEFLDTIKLQVKNKNHKKLLHAQALMDEEMVTQIAERLRAKIWVIGFNRTDVDLITSDSPVVRFGRLGQHGLNSKGIEIFFPITPQLIICLRDPEFFWFDEESHNHFVEVNEEEVKYYNSFQVLQSYRYIFGKKNNFQKVHEIVTEHPELQDIDREKILMG